MKKIISILLLTTILSSCQWLDTRRDQLKTTVTQKTEEAKANVKNKIKEEVKEAINESVDEMFIEKDELGGA